MRNWKTKSPFVSLGKYPQNINQKKKNPLYFRVIRFFQKENTECTLWSKDLFWTGTEKLPSKLKIIKSKLRIPTSHVQSCYH